MQLARIIHFLLFIIRTVNAEELPNLVILFADNLGFDDVSVFQSRSNVHSTKTPNVDSLAADGMKFFNWNSAAALCSASRSALLTGRYPVRTGVYPRVFRPDAKYGLLPEERTLAEMLKDYGYATKIVGKWHLGVSFDSKRRNRYYFLCYESDNIHYFLFYQVIVSLSFQRIKDLIAGWVYHTT